jgi:hypothetical protein
MHKIFRLAQILDTSVRHRSSGGREHPFEIRNNNQTKGPTFDNTKAYILASLCPLATDPPSQLNVFRQDGDALGMGSTHVGVLEESDDVSLRCLLQCKNGLALQMDVSLRRQNENSKDMMLEQLAISVADI